MLVRKAVNFVLTAAILWGGTDAATTAAVKLCGRQLSEIIGRICHESWDMGPSVVERGATPRRKRQLELGIVDECCVIGCTLEQLSEYCTITYSESPLEDLDTHNIADRSVEVSSRSVKSVQSVPTTAAAAPGLTASGERRREVGRGRGRCWCRRKRRSGRRRLALMGNMELAKNVRAAPVVGTVSPLITWGRTLNTDLPTFDRDRYAYVIYT